jgi:hypothetical protein
MVLGDIYRLILVYTIHSLRHSEEAIQFIGRCKLIIRSEAVCPSPELQLEDHPFLAVRICLFNILAAARNWKPSLPSATWSRTSLWWQGTREPGGGDARILLRLSCEYIAAGFNWFSKEPEGCLWHENKKPLVCIGQRFPKLCSLSPP